MSDFKLNDQIKADTFFIKKLSCCELRLLPDGDLPWFLLIPMKNNLIDWDDMSLTDQKLLTEEISYVCKVMKNFIKVDKVNIGSLGNKVPQLHIHVIGRFKDDRAWPGAVWGTEASKEFSEETLQFWLDKFKAS